MECPVCGRWAPGDASTGYDVDEICPRCADAGWTQTRDGALVDPSVSDVSDMSQPPRPRMLRAALTTTARARRRVSS
jgi:hypothetical protein